MYRIVLLVLLMLSSLMAQSKAGDASYGTLSYDDFERPMTCRSCHTNFYYQWDQSMMSIAYTHHWDEIEYFKLAIPHADMEPEVAEVKAGCNGCHTPMAFRAGDTPPPRPEENSRANESVFCDVCHTVTGFEGDIPFNYNFYSSPGKVKYGPKPNVKSPYHTSEYNELLTQAEFCGGCHNEKSPYGIWVKSTHLEWLEGPYPAQNVTCQTCHMPKAEGVSALMGEEGMVAQHLFHGAHDDGKLRSVIEMRMEPNSRELEPGDRVTFSLQLFNAKTGHKFPTGSAEERVVWVHVEAVDANGKTYPLPVDKKGFEGEEYTIASEVLAYQDMGIPLKEPDFKGVRREMIPLGDRIYRMPYLNPDGEMTIMQWYTADLGVDYRIGPRETKVETYTWQVPDDVAPGKLTVKAEMYYRKLPVAVAQYLDVPEEASRAVFINDASTWIEIFD